MATPRHALFTLNEEDDEEDGGSQSFDLNDSNRKLLRAGCANFDSDTYLEEVIQNQLDAQYVKNRIFNANGKVGSLRLTGEENEDEIDDITRTDKRSRRNVQEDLMLRTQTGLIRKVNQLKQLKDLKIRFNNQDLDINIQPIIEERESIKE